MTRPAATAVLLAGLFALSATAQPEPAPLTPQQLDALNRKLAEFAGLDENVKKLLEQFKQNPAALDQLAKQQGMDPNAFKGMKSPVPPPPKPGPNPFPQPGPGPKFDTPPPDILPPNPGGQPKAGQPFNPGDFLKGLNAPENVPLAQDPRLGNNPGLQKMLQLWEQNFGPLDNNPRLKSAVLDMLQSAADIKPDGTAGKDSFWGKLEADGEAKAFADWLEKNTNAQNWKAPNWDFGKWSPPNPKFGNMGGNWSFGGPPPVPSPPSVGGFGSPSLPGGGFGIVLMLILAALVGYLVWKYGPKWALAGREENPLDASRRRWPVDPSAVHDRAALVRAFEYISLTLCGDAARVWNHRTIAAALRAKVPTADPVADELAALYERARYAPPTDPLSSAELADARRCLSVLAGVAPA